MFGIKKKIKKEVPEEQVQTINKVRKTVGGYLRLRKLEKVKESQYELSRESKGYSFAN